MFRKYSILITMLMSLGILFIATLHYPGGSQHDLNSTGYDWMNNYLSNLFSVKAMNGAVNASKPWAIAGMFFLCVSFALFFITFSKKISAPGAAKIIRYAGAGSMVFAFLVVTPFHDIMVTIASTMALLSMFYIAVFVFRSKLHLFKVLCIVCLLFAYASNYIYYSGQYLQILPVMQKLTFGFTMIWILGLTYFTKAEDFQQRNSVKPNKKEISVQDNKRLNES